MKYYNEREETLMRFFTNELLSVEHSPLTDKEKDKAIEKLRDHYLNELFSYRRPSESTL